FTASSIIVAPFGEGVNFATDMDHDGQLDILGPGIIFYGRGNFQFDSVSGNFFGPFAAGDFDTDGLLDIVSRAGTALNQGNRTFKNVVSSGTTCTSDLFASAGVLAVADFNGDGL